MTAVRCSPFKAPAVLHFHYFTSKKRCKVPSSRHKVNGYFGALVSRGAMG